MNIKVIQLLNQKAVKYQILSSYIIKFMFFFSKYKFYIKKKDKWK